MARIRDKENLVKATSEKYLRVSGSFDELSRRLWAANESISMGYGGVEVVSSAIGISKPTIEKGIKEIQENNYPRGRTRREGGGRKELSHKDPGIIQKLRELIEPSVSGDPQSSLLWVSRSIRRLSEEMSNMGYAVSHTKVRSLLLDLGFRLKGNRKNVEGKSHPDRNEQFQHISDTATAFMERNDPVISVDAKKKELIGNFKNNGK
ncbi:Rhodopirellula transposase family protein, partial [mine drainage metagenome]